MRTVDDTLRLALLTPDGVHRAVCGADCAARWLFVETDPLSDDRPLVTLEHMTKRLSGSCAHCVWCGNQVVKVAACRTCPKACPDLDVLVTAVAQRAVLLLQRRAGRFELSPRCWAYLREVATALRKTTAFTSDEVAARVWDRRVDWLG